MKRLARVVAAMLVISGLSSLSREPGHGAAHADSGGSLAAGIAAHPRQTRLAPGQQPGERVSFTSGSLTLQGFLYRPPGDGPFPAVLWNHGSEKLPGAQPELAAFYVTHGYVFFVPHRHGHGKSPGDHIMDLEQRLQRLPADVRQHEIVRLHEKYNDDVAAAAAWLAGQPFVDRDRMVMSGVSYGGIQTVLSAARGLGMKGYAAFAPGAMSWSNRALQERLIVAARNAKAPVFVLQAANDYSIKPVETLGTELAQRGPPNRAKLYPAFGDDNRLGHSAFATWDLGTQVWGDDVLAFFAEAMRAPARVP